MRIKLIERQVLHSLVFVAIFRNVFRVGMNFVNASLHNYFEYRVFVTSRWKRSLQGEISAKNVRAI